MTTVINIKDAPEGWQQMEEYVYIGRAVPRRGLAASDFANIFKIGADGIETREDAIERFREQLKLAPSDFIERIRLYLKGKILVCWCRPKACHGDILAAIADGKEW